MEQGISYLKRLPPFCKQGEVYFRSSASRKIISKGGKTILNLNFPSIKVKQTGQIPATSYHLSSFSLCYAQRGNRKSGTTQTQCFLCCINFISFSNSMMNCLRSNSMYPSSYFQSDLPSVLGGTMFASSQLRKPLRNSPTEYSSCMHRGTHTNVGTQSTLNLAQEIKAFLKSLMERLSSLYIYLVISSDC